MSARVDRVVELVRAIDSARAEVIRLEAELDGMLGGAEPAKATPAPASNGHSNGKATGRRRRRSDPVRDQVVELAKEGLAPSLIATKLNVDRKTVSNYVFRARKAGQIPKAEKHQRPSQARR